MWPVSCGTFRGSAGTADHHCWVDEGGGGAYRSGLGIIAVCWTCDAVDRICGHRARCVQGRTAPPLTSEKMSTARPCQRSRADWVLCGSGPGLHNLFPPLFCRHYMQTQTPPSVDNAASCTTRSPRVNLVLFEASIMVAWITDQNRRLSHSIDDRLGRASLAARRSGGAPPLLPPPPPPGPRSRPTWPHDDDEAPLFAAHLPHGAAVLIAEDIGLPPPALGLL